MKQPHEYKYYDNLTKETHSYDIFNATLLLPQKIHVAFADIREEMLKLMSEMFTVLHFLCTTEHHITTIRTYAFSVKNPK